MKKTFSFLLALVIMISTVSFTVLAEGAEYSGTCGENLTWTLDAEGTLTIEGTGEMTSPSPWASYSNNIKTVIIKDGVTSIGDSAFSWCLSLTSVTIGNSVTSIGNSAFYYCNSLKSVTIGNSVTIIGNYAFESCVALVSAPIPDSVTSIGDWAFANCESLESATINSVTSIGQEAFNGCKSLLSVTIGNSVTNLGQRAFGGCTSLKSIIIPDSVTSIGHWDFFGCSSLESVIIGKSVTTIEEQAFQNCSSLTSVTIPSSVTSIGNYAFGYELDNKIEGFTITGVKGSEAERYATENEFAFNPIDITTLPDNDYFLNKEDGTMPNIVADTLVSDLISTLEEYGITATVTDKDGNVLEGTKKVGTNCKVITPDGEYVVIVTGDVTGDGVVSTTDYLQLKVSLSGIITLEGNYKIAADCDKDGKITSTDFMRIKVAFIGGFEL